MKTECALLGMYHIMANPERSSFVSDLDTLVSLASQFTIEHSLTDWDDMPIDWADSLAIFYNKNKPGSWNAIEMAGETVKVETQETTLDDFMICVDGVDCLNESMTLSTFLESNNPFSVDDLKDILKLSIGQTLKHPGYSPGCEFTVTRLADLTEESNNPPTFEGFTVLNQSQVIDLLGEQADDILANATKNDPVLWILIAKVSKFHICLHISGKFSTVAMRASAYGSLQECIKCIEGEMGETVIRPETPANAFLINLWLFAGKESYWTYDDKFKGGDHFHRYVFTLRISFDSGTLTWDFSSDHEHHPSFNGGYEYSNDGRGGKNLAPISEEDEFQYIQGFDELLEKITDYSYEWLQRNKEIGISLGVFEPSEG